MGERLGEQSVPLVIGQIPNLNGYGYELLFADSNGSILNQGDQRLDDFKNPATDLASKEASNGGKSLVLSSGERQGPLIIFQENIRHVVINDGSNRFQALELGTQANYWFKQPFIIGSQPTGEVDKNSTPLTTRVYKEGTAELRVVARRLPVLRMSDLPL